jgi:hypothetical protein
MIFMDKVERTLGEVCFAALLGTAAAVPAAIVGFVLAIVLCGAVLHGEATESSLVLAPFFAIVAGVGTFAAVFRWMIRYGDPAPKGD